MDVRGEYRFERAGEGEGVGPIHLTEHILSGGLSTRRALRLEGCFSVFLCFSFLSPWLDQLSFRYQMVYVIYLEIIIHIPYSIFHTLRYT